MRTRIRSALAGERQRGSTAVYLAAAMPALLVIGGLTYDAGAKATAGRQASLVAAEAARAAGQHLTSEAIAGQTAGVDTAAGAAAAQAYLSAAGVAGQVSVSGRTITVTTQVPWSPTINTWLPGTTLTGTATTDTVRTT